MKINTKEQLVDHLNNEMAWRKKELFNLKVNVERSSQKLESTAIRSGLVLLYAHWEGFIRCAAEAYLEYVISRRLKYGELAINFIAISLKQQLKHFEQSNKATIHTQIVNSILNSMDDTAIINKENVIRTQSNLNSIVFKEIVTTIGLDFTNYETKSKLIDEQLLNYRNNVAHGQYLEVDVKEYLVLHEEVKNMIDKFKTDVENAAIQSTFIRR